MRLRVLTYNIHRAIGLDGRFAPERIVAVLARYNPDIALLQEVDQGAPRSRMLDLAAHLARELAYQYHALGLNVTLKKGRYGNATLSRFPIGKQRNVDLSIGRYKPRGAQHTRVQVVHGRQDLYVDVFNVHLSLLARLRARQVRSLLATTDIAGLDPAAPCIIAGDTNDWRNMLRRHFRHAGFQCATDRWPGLRYSIKTFPSIAPTGGLDKIFYRGPLELRYVHRSRLKLAQAASDHLPVIADFELPLPDVNAAAS